MIKVLEGVSLHSTVVAALHAAGRQSGGRPVGTRDLLVSLMRCDSRGEWHRIWLHCGDDDAIAAKPVRDPDPRVSGIWHEVRFTRTCAEALEVSRILSERYNFLPLPVGVLALGLIADDTSAASRAMSDGLRRDELVRLVQDAILGTSLAGIDTLLSEAVARAAKIWQTESPASASAENPPPASRGIARRDEESDVSGIPEGLLYLIRRWRGMAAQFAEMEAQIISLDQRHERLFNESRGEALRRSSRAGRGNEWSVLHSQLTDAWTHVHYEIGTARTNLGILRTRLTRISLLAGVMTPQEYANDDYPARMEKAIGRLEGMRASARRWNAVISDYAFADATSLTAEALGDLERVRAGIERFRQVEDSFEVNMRRLSRAGYGAGCALAAMFFAALCTVALLLT